MHDFFVLLSIVLMIGITIPLMWWVITSGRRDLAKGYEGAVHPKWLLLIVIFLALGAFMGCTPVTGWG